MGIPNALSLNKSANLENMIVNPYNMTLKNIRNFNFGVKSPLKPNNVLFRRAHLVPKTSIISYQRHEKREGKHVVLPTHHKNMISNA